MNQAPEERRRRAAFEALSSSMRLAPSTGIHGLARYPEAPGVLICTSMSGKAGSEVRIFRYNEEDKRDTVCGH
jgi:hypothetical protein